MRAKPTPSHKNSRLVCVAHPDDESLFFAGLMLSSKSGPDRARFSVICMTDANADGFGRKRRKQFEKACGALGVESLEWWNYPDIYEKRLPIDEITARLKEWPAPAEVYTHGIIGEYGHPHHQDVSVAVHRAFARRSKVYSVAYNSYPDKYVLLSKANFQRKAELLIHVYGSETSRFLNLLPATFCEGFQLVDLAEIEALYAFFAEGKRLNQKQLKRYAWLADFLKKNRERARPF